MSFTHLHVHTGYSLLDGSCKIKEIISRAKELNMTSLAITDHGVMYGVIDFYKEAKANGIKPILGCEVYVSPSSRFEKQAKQGAGMTNNIIIEDLLRDFAERCGLDDVESFTATFESGLRQGGDIRQVVWDSRKIINDKIEIEMEIKTILTEKENELNIMMVMPLIIMCALSGIGTMSAVVNTPLTVTVKIFAILLFGAAYMMGRKIVNIRM